MKYSSSFVAPWRYGSLLWTAQFSCLKCVSGGLVHPTTIPPPLPPVLLVKTSLIDSCLAAKQEFGSTRRTGGTGGINIEAFTCPFTSAPKKWTTPIHQSVRIARPQSVPCPTDSADDALLFPPVFRYSPFICVLSATSADQTLSPSTRIRMPSGFVVARQEHRGIRSRSREGRCGARTWHGLRTRQA